MIKVHKSFYQNGLTMDGKGNRVMLKRNDETLIEMIFLNGEDVELRGYSGDQVVHSIKIRFNQIYEIGIDNEEIPGPAVMI